MTETTNCIDIFSNRILDEDKVEVDPLISYGQNGRVYKAIVLFELEENKFLFGKLVAVKETRVTMKSIDSIHEMIENEDQIYGRLNHPNVICRLGLCVRSNKVTLIIMEYLYGKSLFDYINELKHDLPFNVVINWLLQIVEGMIYIHSLKLMHCDLKTKNVLMSKKPKNEEQMYTLRIKIANISHCSPMGTVTHMAPEAMQKKFSLKSDVWSFGVVCWELINRTSPFKGYETLQVFYKIGVKKETLDLPHQLDNSFCQLIKKCWIYNEAERPDFVQIKQELLKIKENM